MKPSLRARSRAGGIRLGDRGAPVPCRRAGVGGGFGGSRRDVRTPSRIAIGSRSDGFPFACARSPRRLQSARCGRDCTRARPDGPGASRPLRSRIRRRLGRGHRTPPPRGVRCERDCRCGRSLGPRAGPPGAETRFDASVLDCVDRGSEQASGARHRRIGSEAGCIDAVHRADVLAWSLDELGSSRLRCRRDRHAGARPGVAGRGRRPDRQPRDAGASSTRSFVSRRRSSVRSRCASTCAAAKRRLPSSPRRQRRAMRWNRRCRCCATCLPSRVCRWARPPYATGVPIAQANRGDANASLGSVRRHTVGNERNRPLGRRRARRLVRRLIDVFA